MQAQQITQEQLTRGVELLRGFSATTDFQRFDFNQMQ